MHKLKQYIPLNFDLLFKKVFGDPNDLEPIKYLLKNVLEIEPKEVTILNTELIDRPYKDKRIYVDLIVELKDGTKISIEINTGMSQVIIDRNVYYICRNISKDLSPEEEYKDMNKHIQINFDMKGKHKRPIMSYKIMNKETLEDLTDKIEIIRIDVPFFTRECYNKDIKKLDDKARLIGLFGVEDKVQARALCEGDEKMENIYKRIDKYNNDEDVIGVFNYEARLKLNAMVEKEEAVKEGLEEGLKKGKQLGIEMGMKQGIEQGIKQGIKQGIEKGIEQGAEQSKIKVAQNMLKKSIDVKTISEITDLSIEAIKNLE